MLIPNEIKNSHLQDTFLETKEENLSKNSDENWTKKKRRSDRAKKIKTELDDGGQIHDFEIEEKPSLRRKPKKNVKEFFVPTRISFKSAGLLIGLIDKIIVKMDPLHLLRGYRKEIKHHKSFNQFNSKKVEKIIYPYSKENSDLKYVVNFQSGEITLLISKSNKICENLGDGVIVENHNLLDKLSPIDCDIEMNDFSKEKEISLNEENGQLVSDKDPNVNQSINLRLTSEQYCNSIEETFSNIFIDSGMIGNIDILRYKAENNYYSNMQDFKDDILSMFLNISSNLDELILEERETSVLYLSAIYLEILKSIQEIKLSFKSLYESDIRQAIENNKLPRVNITEFKNIPMKKCYQEIKEYEHIFPNRTNKKTQTNLKPSCAGDCCVNYEDLGPLNLEKSKWDSKCCDRGNNLECIPDVCGCDPNTCRNQSILKKESKILGDDVIEKYSWGIDLFTYRNIIEILPLNLSDEYKAEHFIEKVLIKACCDLDTEGYSMRAACEHISKTSNNRVDVLLASHLIKVYAISTSARNSASIAYSKGIGIFCQKQSGIKKNELIAPYLGEIYPPWYWYEKQDLIKKNKMDTVLPDFYNIMLERHKTDERGYDLVMVDPNSKGNFASRMSHSCLPNCNTVLMASSSQYTIGMFATKDIQYGDELTFDYNSVTEKEKEFQDAICLCSSFNCRGHYLIYSNSNLFTEVLSKHHTFLHRNAILVTACNPNFELNKYSKLTQEDYRLLDKYAIRDSVLETAPFWLKKWAALILKYVEFESKLLPEILYLQEIGGNKSDCKIDHTFINVENKEIKKENNNNTHEIKSSITYTKDQSYNYKQKYDFNSNFIFPKNMKKYTSSRRSGEKNKASENSPATTDTCIKKEVKSKLIFDIKHDINDTDGKKIIHENYDIIADKILSKSPSKIFEVHNDKLEIKKETIIKIKTEDLIMCEEKIAEEHIKINQDTAIIESEIKLKSVFEYKSKLNISSPKEKALYDAYISKVAGITENRIQNIAITVDKVNHVLKLFKTDSPPLILLSDCEIHNHYWNRQDSIRSSLIVQFRRLTNQFSSFEISNRISTILSILSQDVFSKEYSEANNKIRKYFKEIAAICREIGELDKSNKYAFYEGLADMLYLYSSTNTYFKHDKSYEKGADSELLYIRRRDINTNSNEKNLDEPVYKGRKYYDKLYIWGQLIGWYKQTVDKPNASLSAERRGTLSYPEVDSFFVDNEIKGKAEIFKFPINSRKTFYAKLVENPSQMWPVGNLWSYKNKKKIYGTIQFDSIFQSNDWFNADEIRDYLIKTFKNMNS